MLPEEDKKIVSAINAFLANNNINAIAENVFLQFSPAIEGNNIKFKLFNITQIREIENIKPMLEAFVNKHLQRSDIKVDVSLDENARNNNKAYTREEKFAELTNKNAYVKELTELLDLYI